MQKWRSTEKIKRRIRRADGAPGGVGTGKGGEGKGERMKRRSERGGGGRGREKVMEEVNHIKSLKLAPVRRDAL